MSVIQKIRDKYAVVIIVVICVAIVSFLLQDVFFGRNSSFGQSNDVGKVNGTTLNLQEYQTRVENLQARYRQESQGASLDDQTQQYIREQAWDQFLRENIMQKEYDELGIEVTFAEVNDQVNGKNPHPLVRQYFADPQTGQYDPSVLARVRENARQDKTGQIKQQLLSFDQMVMEYQRTLKYRTLVHQGFYYPKWMAQLEQENNAQNANLIYVQVPYATIADSTIKVTDNELNKYIQDNKAMFQVVENRKIRFVPFETIPSEADSTAALADFSKLRAELDTTDNDDIAGFIKLNSELPYYDGYAMRNSIRVVAKDSIVDLPIGKTYGPYQDNNLMVYAKMIDRKTMPDTAKVRHILIALQPGVTDSVAKQRADSLAKVIRAGGDFAALAAQFSDDPNTKTTGGEYIMTPSGFNVPAELNDLKKFAFDGANGEVKVLKLDQIGYSVAKVTEQKNFGVALKIAYLGKRVDATSATSADAMSKANSFASKARDISSFTKGVQEGGLDSREAVIRPMDFVLPGLGSAREVVSWAYNADKGSVSPVFTLEDKFVVAVLTGVQAEGTASLSEVRPAVEAEVRKNKKAEQIIEKLKSPTSVEAAASAVNQPVMTADAVGFTSPFIPAMGFEPRVAGAAFNKAWGTAKVSAPIQGTTGVFVIKVSSYVPTQQPAIDYAQQREAFEQSVQQEADQKLFEALKKKSSIKDNRANFYRSN